MNDSREARIFLGAIAHAGIGFQTLLKNYFKMLIQIGRMIRGVVAPITAPDLRRVLIDYKLIFLTSLVGQTTLHFP